MGDVVRDGLTLIITEFIIIIIYIVISDPVADILTALANAGSDIASMGYYHTLVNNVFTICFILLGLVPIIWFIVRMMSKEPDWGYRYY
jgi:hypothetical protein